MMGAVAGKKLVPIKCLLCDFESKRITAVENHVLSSHNMTAQQLWDVKNSGPLVCKCGCGKTTKWLNFKDGYSLMLKGHNASIYNIYDNETAAAIAKTRGKNWRDKPSWSKGLTKETDERVKRRGELTSIGRKTAFDNNEIQIWSKGLTKETDERVKAAAIDSAKRFANNEVTPWAKGLTKETDDRIKNMAMRVSTTHMSKNLRKRLDELKRLNESEIVSRIEHSGKLKVVGGLSDYVNDATPCIHVECNTCQARFVGSLRKLQHNRCFTCDPSGSAMQQTLFDFIKPLAPDSQANIRSIIKGEHRGAELDIYVPSKKLAIEFNGLYWHSSIQKSDTYHQNKTDSCSAVGITLLHVFEDEWRDKRQIVESMIKHKLGLTPTRIGARECTVKKLSTKERKEFFNTNHIDGDTNSHVAFGLVHEGLIVSAMSLRHPFHKKYSSALEVARFCTRTGVSVVGGLSKLTNVCSEQTSSEGFTSIMSYVDMRLNANDSWPGSGWKRLSQTAPRFWWTDFHDRFNRFRFRADRSRNMSEADVANEANVVRIYGCGNVVYSIDLLNAAA